MASSRKRPTAKKIAVALSGGVDSVVLLHQLKHRPVSAIHVHHGLSPNANAWAEFCRALCRRWRVSLTVKRVRVRRAAEGLEAAAPRARYAAFQEIDAGLIARAPSEAKLAEMLKQLAARGARTLIEHDGARLRVYRNKVLLDADAPAEFSHQEWKGESLLRLPALGGELHFRKARGKGIALEHKPLTI